MEKIFIDTSALYALISMKDSDHEQAILLWETISKSYSSAFTNNYVLAECFALIQNRIGLEVVRHLHNNIVPFLEIDWIDEEQHTIAARNVLEANRRSLSLVDCSAFESMHRLGIETVFTFDEHFREQGFTVVP
jgi:hypothetical protein